MESKKNQLLEEPEKLPESAVCFVSLSVQMDLQKISQHQVSSEKPWQISNDCEHKFTTKRFYTIFMKTTAVNVNYRHDSCLLVCIYKWVV